MSKSKQLRRENKLLLNALVEIEHTAPLKCFANDEGRIVHQTSVPPGYIGSVTSDGRCQHIAREALIALVRIRQEDTE